MPPATAKNVIAMGMSENYRPTWYEDWPSGWNSNGITCQSSQYAAGFNYASERSRRGTHGTSRIKPDMMAPATMITSARSAHGFITGGWCNEDYYGVGRYLLSSGTSFAAPVAAGAALLASRKYSSNPASASPALLKAMLAAGTVSLRGGTDHYSSTTIGPRTDVKQGFGRINLERLLSSTPARFYLNQSHVFTASGGTAWSQSFQRNDGTKPVIVVLAWTDAPGAENATSPLVNDLDLRVNEVPLSNCVIFRGNAIGSDDISIQDGCTQTIQYDHANNVEIVVLPSYIVDFRVWVIPTTIAGQANPSISGNNQDFALYVYNAQ